MTEPAAPWLLPAPLKASASPAQPSALQRRRLRHEDPPGKDHPALRAPVAHLCRPGRFGHSRTGSRPLSTPTHTHTPHPDPPPPPPGGGVADPGRLGRAAAEDQALAAVALEQHEAAGRQLPGTLGMRHQLLQVGGGVKDDLHDFPGFPGWVRGPKAAAGFVVSGGTSAPFTPKGDAGGVLDATLGN